MDDQQIKCAWNGCNAEFTWRKGEQEFYAMKGFKSPRFCQKHREEAKRAREAKAARPAQEDGYRGSNDRELLGL